MYSSQKHSSHLAEFFSNWENWEIRQNKGIRKASLLTIRFTIFFEPIFQTFWETIFWVRHF